MGRPTTRRAPTPAAITSSRTATATAGYASSRAVRGGKLRSRAPASEGLGRRPLAAVVLLGLAAAGGLLWWRGGREAAAPPARAMPSARAAMLQREAPPRPPRGAGPADARGGREAREPAPLESHEVGAKVYAEAVKGGEKNPGEKAFRADAKAFFEQNR